ncbi:MAG: transcriptional regulator [Paucibacter sp.]|nr:transcriptional regulator [Roseateles sp.]
MGINESPSASSQAATRLSLADALFSKTQQRVLSLVFGQPQRSFYANEVIARVGAGSGAVQRELARLVQSELVTVQRIGNQRHYQANPASPIFAELCGIVRKTVGLAEPLRAALAQMTPGPQAAFVYGSVAKQQDTAASDVDLMLVSDTLSYGDVFLLLEDLSQTLGRTVNPTIVTSAEWSKRLRRGDSFAKRVMEQPKIWLVGDEHALGL